MNISAIPFSKGTASIGNIPQITPKFSLYNGNKPASKDEKKRQIEEAVHSIQETTKPQPVGRILASQTPNVICFLEPKIGGRRTIVKIESYLDEDVPPFEVNSKGRFVFAKPFWGFRVTVGDQTGFVSPEDNGAVPKLMESICKVRSLLNGNRVESECLHSSDLPFLPASYWDSPYEQWKDKKVDPSRIGNREAYEEKVYPAIRAYLHTFLEAAQTPAKILEVCGGDGLLAASILEQNKGKIGSYRLLEYSQRNCGIAKQNLVPFEELSTVCRQDITVDYESPIPDGSIDIAIGSGALNHQVLSSKEEALRALARIKRALRAGGILILSGKTPTWLSAEDLKKEGFEVMNRSIPGNSNTVFPCYVAKKRPPSPPPIEDEKESAPQPIPQSKTNQETLRRLLDYAAASRPQPAPGKADEPAPPPSGFKAFLG